MNRLLAPCLLTLIALPLWAQDNQIMITPLEEEIGELVITPYETEEALAPSTEEQVEEVMAAEGGELRVLDKLTGAVTDLALARGETAELGFLTVTLQECRYPVDNPAGDAFAQVQLVDRKENLPLFGGWLIASAPALNAVDHPRYDVWALRCITS